MRGHAAAGRSNEVDQPLVDLGGLDATEPEPDVRHRVQKAGQEDGKSAGILEIATVMAEVDPG